MVVDLLELERMASERGGYPGLHFEYTLSEVGGAGWIYLTPGKTLPLKATDLPDVMKNIMKFAADRLKMREDVLRAWAKLQMGEELPCEALTRAGKPCQNFVFSEDVVSDPTEFDPVAKIYCHVHRRRME